MLLDGVAFAGIGAGAAAAGAEAGTWTGCLQRGQRPIFPANWIPTVIDCPHTHEKVIPPLNAASAGEAILSPPLTKDQKGVESARSGQPPNRNVIEAMNATSAV
jgi:hypothetical protein